MILSKTKKKLSSNLLTAQFNALRTQYLDFPPKMLANSNELGRHQLWDMPSKFHDLVIITYMPSNLAKLVWNPLSLPLFDEMRPKLTNFRGEITKARTPQDMDGTLTLIFANSGTIWDIITKISAFLQL